MQLFYIALKSLTRVPVPASVALTPARLNDSARHFPAVGACIGAFGASVLWGAAHVWPAALAILLSLIAMLWLTLALHEGGLARTCDALGGIPGREPAPRSVNDTAIGLRGTIALIAVLALKAAALHGLATRDLTLALAALPWAHAVSRAVPVALLALLAPVSSAVAGSQRGVPMPQQVTPATLGIAALWCAAVTFGVAAAGWPAQHLTAALLAAVFVTAGMNRWLRARIGGFTDSALSAAQQGAEVLILLTLLGALARG